MRRGLNSALNNWERPELWENREIDESIFTSYVDRIADRMKANLKRFQGCFPEDEAKQGVYGKLPGVKKGTWGAGYWVGIHWLLYHMVGDPAFKSAAYAYTSKFERTLTHEHYDTTHCVGCEADPALVWGYRFTGDIRLRELAVRAAEIMLDRYVPSPGFVHMAGSMEDPYPRRRVLIDSFTVTPILYFGTEFSGNPVFAETAITNGYTLLRNNIRNDGSLLQLTEFEYPSGKYIRHMPHQGLNLESTWSRGSGWAAWGLPDLYRFTGDPEVLYAAEQVIRYYMNHLPEDMIPYWDLSLSGGSPEPRDTSAAALVSVGIQKLLAVCPSLPEADTYRRASDAMLAQLLAYGWEERSDVEGLLAHVCANRPRNRNIDEYTTWGDYYLVEALYYRLGGKLF